MTTEIQDLAELLSLWLTTPTIVLGVYVVVLWFHGAFEAARKRNRNATDWFMLGVAIGFVGGCVDNGYWGLAWMASYLELESTQVWFNYGVFSNIPFRQVPGVLAAYCHVRSAIEFSGHGRLSVVLWGSFAAGLAIVLVLMVIKNI